MSLSIGIVGLPNVGKSTLFNALLGANRAAVSNFPFCTIQPNTGIVPVPDNRLDKIAEWEKSAQIVPAAIEFVDIAGLVRGAAQGEGLGNQFLSHIREVDAIVEVIRLFPDTNITHVSGNINPKDDIEIVNTELALADLQSLTKQLVREEKAAKANPKLQLKVTFWQKLKQHLGQGYPARSLTVIPAEQEYLKEAQLLTAKPILYVANIDSMQIKEANTLLNPIQELIAADNAEVIAIDAKTEADVVALSPAEQTEYLRELSLTESGLNKVIRTGYKLLGLITFFTANEKEAHSWIIPQGATALEAAAIVHTDFAKGFIRAEVAAYTDLVQHNGWIGTKAAGKVRSEGKDYVVKDGDILLFRFNV